MPKPMRVHPGRGVDDLGVKSGRPTHIFCLSPPTTMSILPDERFNISYKRKALGDIPKTPKRCKGGSIIEMIDSLDLDKVSFDAVGVKLEHKNAKVRNRTTWEPKPTRKRVLFVNGQDEKLLEEAARKAENLYLNGPQVYDDFDCVVCNPMSLSFFVKATMCTCPNYPSE